MAEKKPKPRIYTENNPTVTRILPGLAEAIGLNESIVLMQLDYLIGISDNYRDGQWWTWQSLRDLKNEYFPYWSIQTIDRAIKSLEKKGLITVANYNKHEYDKTRWFAINPKSVSELDGVTIAYESVPKSKGVSQNGTARSKMEQGVSQNGTGVFQNGTTIPETTTEITKPETTQRKEEDERTPVHVQPLVIDRTPRHRQETISQFHKKFCEILRLTFNKTNQYATKQHAYELYNDNWTIQDLVYVRRYCDDGHYPKDITKFQVKGIIGTARAHYEQSAAPDSQYGDQKGEYPDIWEYEQPEAVIGAMV